MVDAVVSYVVEKLGDTLLQEAKFLGGVKGEVQWLQRELKLLRCYIKDAEGKQGDHEPIRQWISHVRDIAYDVEDVLDLFMLKIVGSRKKGFLSSIEHRIKKPRNRHEIGKDFEKIKDRIIDLSRQRECYDLRRLPDRTGGQSSASNTPRHLRRANSFAVEKDFVGFEDDIKILLDQLLNDKPDRHVISIFGTGGLGKTTLARKLYHHNEVQGKFACCAWVCVSQDYKGRALLLSLIRSFKINGVPDKELERMQEVDLERYLYEYLQQRSYLVVVDDVWEEDAWGRLRRAFPDNNNNSRVIITTRKRNVADCYYEKTYVHKLQFLTKEDSWELFCKKAFWKLQRDEGLDKLGKEMVEKCRGLPLAIVVLGGLLSTKNFHEWQEVRRNIWQNLENGSIEIKSLLSLSFDDLSSELKLFFLYMSHFPEDCDIDVEELNQKVVAEGLIVEHQGEIMEDIAKDNLHELINRSLIQIGKRCWGRIVTCKLLDLLRDLTVRKAGELNFISICDKCRSSSMVSLCRRHAIYSANNVSSWLHKSNPLTRSLVFFTGIVTVHDICKKFMLLRLFDVQDANFEYRNEGKKVRNLILLKYLKLRCQPAKKLPSSFGNLQRLQTLDVGHSAIELPASTCQMKDLRHLIGNFKGHFPLNDLTELQTLNAIWYESWIKLDHHNFFNLRELYIIGGYTREMIRLESISNLISLRVLSISSTWDRASRPCYTLSSLQPLSDCKDLKELGINEGEIDELPEDMDILFPNLVCLSLSNSKLKHDPMPTLEKLPNLKFLDLGYGVSNVQEKMVCSTNGFPRLEVIVLELSILKKLQVEDRAMPVLQGLRIRENFSDEAFPGTFEVGARVDFSDEAIPEKYELVIPERLRSVPLPVEQSYVEDIVKRYHYNF